MSTINLTNKVLVTDPCYKFGTWCQAFLENVKPGSYKVFCHKADSLYGQRVSHLIVVHEDHLKSKLLWSVQQGATIGVDSGQAGIFSFPTYRENDDWYKQMCNHTMSPEQFGCASDGAVSSSGWGDGQYLLLTAHNRSKVVGICIDFLIEELNPNQIIK